ncbi:MAG: hypothetical protein Kow00121_00060 [Elainellaceae cyanobacterium]
MIAIIENKSKSTTWSLVDQIFEAGKMSRQQHFQLASAILSGQKITDEERRQINRAFDYIQTGKIQLID